MKPDNFADSFQKYTTPFLQREEAHHPGTSEQLLTDYLSVLAKDDLRPCLYIFQTAHTKVVTVYALKLHWLFDGLENCLDSTILAHTITAIDIWLLFLISIYHQIIFASNNFYTNCLTF